MWYFCKAKKHRLINDSTTNLKPGVEGRNQVQNQRMWLVSLNISLSSEIKASLFPSHKIIAKLINRSTFI